MYNGAICRGHLPTPAVYKYSFLFQKKKITYFFSFFLINRIQTLFCINNESSVDIEICVDSRHNWMLSFKMLLCLNIFTFPLQIRYTATQRNEITLKCMSTISVHQTLSLFQLFVYCMGTRALACTPCSRSVLIHFSEKWGNVNKKEWDRGVR